VTTALTGGEALDFAAQVQPHIILVKDQLPDLPGRMVVKTAKNAAPDAVTILYTPPNGPARPGEVSMVDAGGAMILLREYTRPEELAEPLREIREGIRQKLKERRYLQAFRQEQRDFLNRYNAVRQRIAEGLAKVRR
jgi:DNA-binding NarL/FixJ family response regulator